MVPYCFKEFIYVLLKHSEGLTKFFVHYLFFGTSKTLLGQVPYGNLLVPGHVSTCANYTLLPISSQLRGGKILLSM